MDSVLKLIENIEYCLLPKLARNFDECENHPEYDIRKNKLDQHYHVVIELMGDLDLRETAELAPSVLSSLLIMYKELQSDGPWNTEKSKEYAKQLNYHFAHLYEITLDNLLQRNNIFNIQDVFDKCVENLHRKLTSEEFKKYPGRIEVYCSLIEDVKEYRVLLHPLKTLPVSLLLIDDYINTNKIKGLKCFKHLLQCLSAKDFQNGNYYEVIYGCFKKAIVDKDLEVTKLVFECYVELLKLLPPEVKTSKLDDLHSNVLDQIYTESNLYRKATCFRFIKNIIQEHKINCVKRKKIFFTIICDNIDMCTNEAISEILLFDVLECVEAWIKYCWCVWKLPSDQKLLSVLFKILYVINKEAETSLKVQNLILTLISLCTKDEQNKILNNLEKSSQVPSQEFLEKINDMRKSISA